MWSKYKQLLTAAHRFSQQTEISLTWTTAVCVTFALYLSVWMRFADFIIRRRPISEGFPRAASWRCQLVLSAAVVVVLSVDDVISDVISDDRMCCLSDDDVLSRTAPSLSERRMNSGGREEDLPASTGSAFPTTTTAAAAAAAAAATSTVATAASRPRPSPSSIVWHSSVDASPPPPQQQTRLLGRLYESPAGAATPFRSPMSPLKTGSSAGVYLPFGQMAAAHAALYPPLGRPGFMSGAGGGFFPRLPPHPPHQPMTSGFQQSYLTNPNEPPYGQSSLIQISQLPPPPPPPPPPRPLPIQYPSFLGRLSSSLDGDSITGSHVISLHRQQQSPSPSHRLTSAFDPFQRSPMPEPPAQVQRSPVQVHFTPDDRSQFDRRTQRRGAGGGGGGGTVTPSRSVPHLSTPLQSLARHQGRPPPTLAEIRTLTATRAGQRPEMDTFRRLRPEPDPRQTARQSSSSPPSEPIDVCAPPPLPPPPPPPVAASSLQQQQQPQHPHYPAHFVRGSIIQLGSGQLKRIEDLRTTDFVDSAGISDDLRIDSSTVIHMRQNHERNTVVLGFSVGQQSIQVTVEATLEHPFFVYNQGWSSYSPELTRRRFGLDCRQLNVGNCCISLTQRPPPPPPTSHPTVPAADARSLLHHHHHHRRPVSSSPSRAPDPRGVDAEESAREEEEEEEEEVEGEGEGHCSSSHRRRFVPGFSGFATHSTGSAPLGGGEPTTPSVPSAARTGRKRRWSAPDVFRLSHPEPQRRFHHRRHHHHHHLHHRENIPRSSLGEVSEEEEAVGRAMTSSSPPPPFQLPSTES